MEAKLKRKKEVIAHERAGILRVEEALDWDKAELESQRREITQDIEDLERDKKAFSDLLEKAEEDHLSQQRELEAMMEMYRLDREVNNVTVEILRQR